MISTSLQSIRRVSLLYALFSNVHSSTRSSSNPKILEEYQVLLSSLCNRNSWNFGFKKQLLKLATTRIFASRLSSDTLKMLNYLPFFASGNIVTGFGRGSKELGIPTANYPLEVVKSLPDCFKPGVYFGWANINNGPVYKMVMSIGWNPFYDNKEKSMETHILHDFNRDLYGCLLKVCIVGYLRPEQNFDTLEDLVACIKSDIKQAEELLESNSTYKQLKVHQFFQENSSDNTNCKSVNSK